MRPKSDNHFQRRGIAIIAFVAAMLIIGSASLWLFHLSAANSRSALGHYFSSGAFYAAESGLEMALRELNQGNDFDSDGTIGTISDTGNALVSGAVSVIQSIANPPTYQANGRPIEASTPWSDFRRVIEARVE